MATFKRGYIGLHKRTLEPAFLSERGRDHILIGETIEIDGRIRAMGFAPIFVFKCPVHDIYEPIFCDGSEGIKGAIYSLGDYNPILVTLCSKIGCIDGRKVTKFMYKYSNDTTHYPPSHTRRFMLDNWEYISENYDALMAAVGKVPKNKIRYAIKKKVDPLLYFSATML